MAGRPGCLQVAWWFALGWILTASKGLTECVIQSIRTGRRFASGLSLKSGWVVCFGWMISKACGVHAYAMCIHRWCLSWESCTSSRGGETSCNRWWLQSFTKEASTWPVTVTTQHTLSTLYYFIHVVAIVDVTGCTPCFSNVPHVVSFAFGKRIIHTYANIWHITIVCLCVCARTRGLVFM